MNKNELQKQLIQWRHHLHQYPETAFEEVKTSAYIAQELKKWSWTFTKISVVRVLWQA